MRRYSIKKHRLHAAGLLLLIMDCNITTALPCTARGLINGELYIEFNPFKNTVQTSTPQSTFPRVETIAEFILRAGWTVFDIDDIDLSDAQSLSNNRFTHQ